VPALIVGLGNPGKEYADTRHNIGFRTVDELARRGRMAWEKPRLKAAQARGTLAGREVVLAKPQTYMNLSGVSVVQLVKWYKVPLDQLLIVHDDLDLPFGHLRLRAEGSAGGQNGMDSIIEQLRTRTIPRLKLGIGRPSWGDASGYVLTRFTKDQHAELPTVIAAAADAAELWLAEGIIAAMNKFNGAVSRDRARS
jgi:PTH1 family peptidyl-tRNA hydrolase